MLSCGGVLKADENWMSAETSSVGDVARGQREVVFDIYDICNKLRHAITIMTNTIKKCGERYCNPQSKKLAYATMHTACSPRTMSVPA